MIFLKENYNFPEDSKRQLQSFFAKKKDKKVSEQMKLWKCMQDDKILKEHNKCVVVIENKNVLKTERTFWLT